MTSKPINFSTGPVEIRKEVFEAMGKAPVSHRSPKFVKYFLKTIDTFKSTLKVDDVFILTGSGTLANETMLGQIKANKGKGLILINGEFGRRLKKQAKRISLDFMTISLEWGESFDLKEIESTIEYNNIEWILFTHCETSTGVLNDLDSISKIASKNRCRVYADCMSTIGTMPINLENVQIATASAGKGLGSIAGLALIFSNTKIKKNKKSSKYLDLSVYAKNGIPFTISSNLVEALSIAISNNMLDSRWKELESQAGYVFDRLVSTGKIPFAERGSRVFTICPGTMNAEEIYYRLLEKGLLLSCQSTYLLKRNWLQVALFGDYSNLEIEKLCDELIKELKIN